MWRTKLAPRTLIPRSCLPAPHLRRDNLTAADRRTGAQLREFKTELSDAQVLLAEMREAERSRRGERRMVERQKKAVAARQELAERCA